jgi:ribosomal protein L17
MKKIGRGASYRKALLQNLENSLLSHKKIRTTKSRGKILVDRISRIKDLLFSVSTTSRRRGDNAPQTIIELIEKNKEKHDIPNKTKTN